MNIKQNREDQHLKKNLFYTKSNILKFNSNLCCVLTELMSIEQLFRILKQFRNFKLIIKYFIFYS
jgi:hypothetical protein